MACSRSSELPCLAASYMRVASAIASGGSAVADEVGLSFGRELLILRNRLEIAFRDRGRGYKVSIYRW